MLKKWRRILQERGCKKKVTIVGGLQDRSADSDIAEVRQRQDLNEKNDNILKREGITGYVDRQALSLYRTACSRVQIVGSWIAMRTEETRRG
jgi:hypothetical protein